MNEFLTALADQSFLRTALLAGLLASIGCGVVGTYVVVKRIAFLAGGISHSVLGGMGAALYYGFDPLLGALIAAVVSALVIGAVRLAWRAQEDTLIGAIWAIGMAVGILYIAKTPGYSADLMSYLFGNILLVPVRDLWLMAALDLVLLLAVALFYRQFLAVSFDEEFARLRGVPVAFFYLLLLTPGGGDRGAPDPGGGADPGDCAPDPAGGDRRALCALPGGHDGDRDPARGRFHLRGAGPVLRAGPAGRAHHDPAGRRRLCGLGAGERTRLATSCPSARPGSRSGVTAGADGRGGRPRPAP